MGASRLREPCEDAPCSAVGAAAHKRHLARLGHRAHRGEGFVRQHIMPQASPFPPDVYRPWTRPLSQEASLSAKISILTAAVMRAYPCAFKNGDPKRRIAALEMLGTLFLCNMILTHQGPLASRVRLPVGSDNQGNVMAMLNLGSKKPYTAAILMELVLEDFTFLPRLLMEIRLTLARTHPSCRDRIRWVTHFPWVADSLRPGCLRPRPKGGAISHEREDESLAPTQCLDKRVIACLCCAVWSACIH